MRLGKQLAAFSAIIALGAALRLFRLSQWGLEGDEIFTLRDSTTLGTLVRGKALLFHLNHYFIRPWHHLDEFGVRILPAVFGIAAIAVLYSLSKRVLNARAGLAAALLLSVSPLHLFWSQFARYYSLVFLLSMAFPLVLYVGLEKRDPKWIALGVVLAGLAVLAHPTAAAVVLGVAVWALIAYLWPAVSWERRRPVPKRSWPALGVVVLGTTAAAYYLVPVLASWYELGEAGWGLRGLPLLLSYADSLQPGVVFAGGAGLIVLWLSTNRKLAGLLAATIAVPIVLFTIISYSATVSTAYLFASTPAFYIAGGYFIDRLAARELRCSIRTIAALVAVAIVLAEAAPRILSHYRDGSRLDLRGAARYVRDHLQESDVVLSDQQWTAAHYLPEISVGEFTRDPAELSVQLRSARAGNPQGRLWIIATVLRRGGFSSSDLAGATEWVRGQCRLRLALGVSRLDFKFNQVQVYICE
jgi:hypothetical protein